MNPFGFKGIILQWDEGNLNHLKKHNVVKEEVESIFRQDNKIYPRRHGRNIQIIGATQSGRILFLALEWQRGNLYRVVTAYDADVTQKRLYTKRGK